MSTVGDRCNRGKPSRRSQSMMPVCQTGIADVFKAPIVEYSTRCGVAHAARGLQGEI